MENCNYFLSFIKLHFENNLQILLKIFLYLRKFYIKYVKKNIIIIYNEKTVNFQ